MSSGMNWDRIERLLGREVLDSLKSRTVGVIGLGSGGSFVAVSLAMSGVGRFILIDNDTLEVENVVRHAADLRDVGQPKVEAVAALIRQRNPQAEIMAVMGKVEDHLNLLDQMDVIVAGLDNEAPKYVINQVARDHRRAVIYAGVYERGEGGDVCLILPNEGPCYACWAEHLREGFADAADNAEELDYGMIGPEGTVAAEPGLWLHVVRVAAAQADMTLNYLVQGTVVYRELPANTVIIANTFLEIYEGHVALPYTAEWVKVPRNPSCLVCGHLYQQSESQGEHLSLGDLASQGSVIFEADDSHGEQRIEDHDR